MVKVLVIEDETEIRANLLELLQLEGYDVISADNGATGLIGALECKPDIILCDVMMPELDGHDVLEALRQEPETALTPFIFLTALADKGDIRKGMTLGADDYITKPFTCLEVINAIDTRLQKKTALAEQQETEQATIAALQEEVRKFRGHLNNEQAGLIDEVRSHMKASLSQLSTVTNTLKTLPPGKQREQCVAILQSMCATKVKLLTKIPNFDYLSESLPFEPAEQTSQESPDIGRLEIEDLATEDLATEDLVTEDLATEGLATEDLATKNLATDSQIEERLPSYTEDDLVLDTLW
ncbi:MAG: response regulator [Cyanobacteria bacterium P01_C01_bin.121]